MRSKRGRSPAPAHTTSSSSGPPPVTAGATNTVTLTVTDTSGHQESQTLSFFFPASTGTITSGGGTMSWPQSLAPSQTLAGSASFPSQNVSVAATSGALDTDITLPTYNPNVPAVDLTYDSITAYPQPIVVANHTLDPTQTVPSQVSAQLTYGGTAESTYYYNTSAFIPGDIQQLAQQGPSGLSTGRYSYTLTVADIRSTTTTTTITGSDDVTNDSSSAIGDGWTVSGLEKITSASGGVILDLGSGGRSLWFSGSFGSGGGTYTDQAGEFSSLTLNSGGTYTRTLTTGLVINFNSSGQETSTVDLNGLRTTYGYTSGNLTTITDPYNNVTTFSYSSGLLSTIADPAGRVATFTHSGGDLSGVTLPDSSTWGYGYDSDGSLTHVTDPNSHTTTIAYDSAERVTTITAARRLDSALRLRAGTGLDQHRHVGQPGHRHAPGRLGGLVYRPAGQHHQPPLGLDGLGADEPNDGSQRRCLDHGPQLERPGHRLDRQPQPRHARIVRQQGQCPLGDLSQPVDGVVHLQQRLGGHERHERAGVHHNLHV